MSVRVLIVEDDDVVRNAFVKTLKDAGFEVDQASDGEEGLAKLRAGKTFSIVVTDINMPGLSGPEMLEQAKAALKSAHIVIMGGDAPSAAPAGLKGATMLAKPIAPSAFLAAIQTLAAKAA
jgi:two-component system response regulator FlrC